MVPFLSWCRYTAVVLMEDGDREHECCSCNRNVEEAEVARWKRKIEQQEWKDETDRTVDKFFWTGQLILVLFIRLASRICPAFGIPKQNSGEHQSTSKTEHLVTRLLVYKQGLEVEEALMDTFRTPCCLTLQAFLCFSIEAAVFNITYLFR